MHSKDVRVFLESPNTLEYAAENNLKNKQLKIKSNKKAQNTFLTCSTLPISIYLENDYSKLTERQKILALKFRANQNSLNPLFMAVNGITNDSANFDKNETKLDKIKNIKKSAQDMGDNKAKQSSTLIKSNRLVGLRTYKRARNTKDIKQKKETPCDRCSLDLEDLLNFITWFSTVHNCEQVAEVSCMKEQLKSYVKDKKCVCKIEKKLFIAATKISNMDCNC